MVLGFREHHAFAGNQLRCRRLAALLRQLHGTDERFTDVPHHHPARRIFIGQTDLAEDAAHDLDVLLRLFQVFGPLLFQVLIDRALQSRLVDLHAAELGLQHLLEKLA